VQKVTVPLKTIQRTAPVDLASLGDTVVQSVTNYMSIAKKAINKRPQAFALEVFFF
jgi:hypothetical protein